MSKTENSQSQTDLMSGPHHRDCCVLQYPGRIEPQFECCCADQIADDLALDATEENES